MQVKIIQQYAINVVFINSSVTITITITAIAAAAAATTTVSHHI